MEKKFYSEIDSFKREGRNVFDGVNSKNINNNKSKKEELDSEEENNYTINNNSYNNEGIENDTNAQVNLFLQNKYLFTLFEYIPDVCQRQNIEFECKVIEDIDWNNNKSFAVKYKAYKNVPQCIIGPMEFNGVQRTKSFFTANLIWKLLKFDKMSILIKKLNKYQRYNHFPCTWSLGRKDNLYRNFKVFETLFPEDFNFMPLTFILPEDSANKDYVSIIKKDNIKQHKFLIKPVASSRGRGIRMLTNQETIPRKCLLSSYIANPHIINNKKYDLRLYVLITGFDPLKIYLFKEGLVRFACEEYSAHESHIHNRYMHLTNYSINKCSNNYDKNVSTEDGLVGSKWSLRALKTNFEEHGINYDLVFDKIKDVIVKAIILAQEETNNQVKRLTKFNNTLFELYGFDILLDETFKPWLLEINLNPSLNCDTDLDLKVKTNVMTDIFNIVGLTPFKHSSNSKVPETLNYNNINSGFLKSNKMDIGNKLIFNI